MNFQRRKLKRAPLIKNHEIENPLESGAVEKEVCVSNLFKRSLSEQRFKKWLLVIIIIIIIIIIIAKRVKLSPFHFFVVNESQWVLMSLN